jgi:hypothetical protein
MKPATLLCSFTGYAVAVAVATVWGSVFQTQHNLARLTALGAEVPTGARLDTTVHDLAGFAPLYALVVAATLAVVFVFAGLLGRLLPEIRYTLHALGAGLGLAVAIRAIDAYAPMPTLIAATRSFTGLVVMALGALLAGWLYAWITRPRP